MVRWLLVAALAFSGAAGADDRAPATITELPADVREQFAERVLAGKASQKERLERLVAFVFDPGGLAMRYEDGATYTVAEAYRQRKANCLGFTLLFLALAREAKLEAYPQVIEETLAWHRSQGTFYRSSHVNAQVRVGARTYTLDVARDVVITRGRPIRLSEERLLGRYHNNVAVERMEAGDFVAARQHMALALELDPGQASHWSNAGVIELRAGDAEAARRAYARALELDAENTDALFNSVSMARRSGDAAREAEFRDRLRRVQQKDPFHHFLQAIDYERAGDFPQAVAHYRRAIELHRGDHRFHAALAGALERSGDFAAARAAWKRAVASSEGDTRAVYQARLLTLPVQ